MSTEKQPKAKKLQINKGAFRLRVLSEIQPTVGAARAHPSNNNETEAAASGRLMP